MDGGRLWAQMANSPSGLLGSCGPASPLAIEERRQNREGRNSRAGSPQRWDRLAGELCRRVLVDGAVAVWAQNLGLVGVAASLKAS